jgi:hypothetical protein
LRILRRASLGCLLAAVGIPVCAGQAVSVKPLHTFDVLAAVRARTGREDFDIKYTAEKGARWVTLVSSRTAPHSMLITGAADGSMRFSDYIRDYADRVAMDGSDQIHVRLLSGMRGYSEIQVMDRDLKPVATQVIGEANLEPIASGPDLFWRMGATLYTAYPSEARLEARLSGPLPPEISEETYLLFGSRSASGVRQWIQLRYFSERITVTDEDGLLLAAAKAPIDDAYRLANLPVPAQGDRESGATRINWACVSRAGYLYVRLSILPVSLPAQIAVIDPLKARLVKVIAAELPTAAARVSEHNQRGFIYPTFGAVDEQLVMVDAGAGLLAVYPIE